MNKTNLYTKKCECQFKFNTGIQSYKYVCMILETGRTLLETGITCVKLFVENNIKI